MKKNVLLIIVFVITCIVGIAIYLTSSNNPIIESGTLYYRNDLDICSYDFSKKEEAKIKAFFEDNVMKRKLEEERRQEAIRLEEKQKEEALKNTATQYFFNVGERVFHEKLGVGEIADVIQIGESTMYTIDFGKMGKKAMDATYARLKKI